MLRKLPVVLTMFMMLATIGIITPQVSSAKGGLISFTPILQVEVRTDAIKEPIQPDGPAVNVPVVIKYRVDVPGILSALDRHFPLIKNMIIYGNMIVPPMKVHLSIANKPEWMDVSIASPDVYIDIKENEFSYANTSLSIAIYKDAPAQPYTLILRAESDALGKVAPQSVESQFKITPGYIPLITINTDEPVVEAGPMATVTIPLRIVNNANKETVVRLIDYDVPPGWGVQPSTDQLIIPENKEAVLSLSVTTPAGFGWMPNQIQQIRLKFIVLPYPPPLHYEETPSNVRLYSISVKSGSTPMIGLIGIILAIIVIVIALIIFVMKKKS